jgi:hypothetical protein
MITIRQYASDGTFITSTEVSDARIAFATVLYLIRRGETVTVS